MIDSKFPKRTSQSQKGLIGQVRFQQFVLEQLGCIYHTVNQENDSGIDGYIELVQNEQVIGKLIAVQIKHGNSYFRKKTKTGYKYTGSMKHLNYYLNQQQPVFIILINDSFSECLWVEFSIDKLFGVQNSSNWSIEIPYKNRLDTNFKDAIFNSVSPIMDFEDISRWSMSINHLLNESKYMFLAISQLEVETMNFDKIKNLVDRLEANGETLYNSRNTFEIFFPDYDDDKREVFDIPEVSKWLIQSIEEELPWFYLLRLQPIAIGMKLLLHGFCRKEKVEIIDGRYLFNYNINDMHMFLEKNFANLNKFTEKNDISISVNEEISKNIRDFFQSELVGK